MRLIDADALGYEVLEEYGADGGSDDVKVIYGMIINAPTIDIVRCADCKYSGAWFGHTMKCKRFHQLFDESFYCAFGEWVEEEQ